MPVVPIRKSDSAGQGFSPRKPPEISAADEPWMLMAAAQMDKDGRLMSNIDDRRDQGRKETDNRMVEDLQQRSTGKEILNRLMDEKSGRESKLGRALGAEDMKGD